LPDRIKNKHNFPRDVVNRAADLLHRWFDDDNLGPCRVVEFGGHSNADGTMSPLLYYTYLDADKTVVEESSTVDEVEAWVQDDVTNI
jgi:hypothetical protein